MNGHAYLRYRRVLYPNSSYPRKSKFATLVATSYQRRRLGSRPCWWLWRNALEPTWVLSGRCRRRLSSRPRVLAQATVCYMEKRAGNHRPTGVTDRYTHVLCRRNGRISIICETRRRSRSRVNVPPLSFRVKISMLRPPLVHGCNHLSILV